MIQLHSADSGPRVPWSATVAGLLTVYLAPRMIPSSKSPLAFGSECLRAVSSCPVSATLTSTGPFPRLAFASLSHCHARLGPRKQLRGNLILDSHFSSHCQGQSLPYVLHGLASTLALVSASLAELFESMSQGISKNVFLPGGQTWTHSLSTQDTGTRRFRVQDQHGLEC